MVEVGRPWEVVVVEPAVVVVVVFPRPCCVVEVLAAGEDVVVFNLDVVAVVADDERAVDGEVGPGSPLSPVTGSVPDDGGDGEATAWGRLGGEVRSLLGPACTISGRPTCGTVGDRTRLKTNKAK